MQITKRTGEKQDFSTLRIIEAIQKAGGTDKVAEKVANKIQEKLINNEIEPSVVSIEKNVVLFSELLGIYPRDLRLGIMKEIKRDYKDGIYKHLLDTEEFLEAFFNVFK